VLPQGAFNLPLFDSRFLHSMLLESTPCRTGNGFGQAH
jgi:hypothetical protein